MKNSKDSVRKKANNQWEKLISTGGWESKN